MSGCYLVNCALQICCNVAAATVSGTGRSNVEPSGSPDSLFNSPLFSHCRTVTQFTFPQHNNTKQNSSHSTERFNTVLSFSVQHTHRVHNNSRGQTSITGYFTANALYTVSGKRGHSSLCITLTNVDTVSLFVARSIPRTHFTKKKRKFFS